VTTAAALDQMSCDSSIKIAQETRENRVKKIKKRHGPITQRSINWFCLIHDEPMHHQIPVLQHIILDRSFVFAGSRHF
jgi:hypothetical protein